MRILVVDGDPKKRADVKACLFSSEFGAEIAVSEAIDYEDALSALKREFFELVVLDVLLPGGAGPPTKDFSRALIKKITAGSDLIPPTNIIALTAFPEESVAEKDFYSEHIFGIELYDPSATAWRDRLLSKIRYLRRSKRAGAEFYRNSFDFDLLVVTARYDNEFLPVKQNLFSEIVATEHGIWRGPLAIGVVKLPGNRTLRACLICVSEMGMATTASVASEAIALFRPRLAAMLGICCGFDVPEAAFPQKLLNAVVVRETSCWEVGKYVEDVKTEVEFKNRSKARLVNDGLRDEVEEIIERQVDTIARDVARLLARASMKRCVDALPKDKVGIAPEVRFGNMVSGSSVIASQATVQEIILRHPTAVGLDMEVYGFYTAVEKCLGLKPSVLAVKGVADFGDAQKSDAAQKVAAAVATIVFKSVISNLRMFADARA